MPTSMILRFRDLAGPTIQAHKAIIDQHGSVWWAWWDRPSENIPRDFFAGLKSRINQDGHVEVYLADSGTYRLYKTWIVEIRESETEDKIPSPDASKTPNYYCDNPYKAWFRLSSIDEISTAETEAELRRWSYDEVPGFTEDPSSDRYQSKRVFDLRELLNRTHRTIYFLAPFVQGQATHRVDIYSVPPKNFLRDPIFAGSTFIVHLSDLHFGAKHGFPLDAESQPGKRPLVDLIIEDLKKELNGIAPACIAVTGDLTWTAAPNEFELARRFLERLRVEFSLERHQFLMVPGNHDIKWIEDPAQTRVGTQPQEVKFTKETARAAYREFYADFYSIEPNIFFSQGRRFLLRNYVSVDIIGLSSSELESTHFAGYGFVREEQLRRAVEEMDWPHTEVPRTTYRMVLLHHHLLPVVPQEEITTVNRNYSITLDAGHILDTCRKLKVDLVLHGHQHHHFMAGLTLGRASSFVIAGGGSVGVDSAEIPSRQNFYSIYNCDPDTIQVRVRTKSPADLNFREFSQVKLEHVGPGALRFA